MTAPRPTAPTWRILSVSLPSFTGQRWPVPWSVELIVGGETYRLTGELRLRPRRPTDPTRQRPTDVLIQPLALHHYRRRWSRWQSLRIPRWPLVVRHAVATIRARVDARYGWPGEGA